jgi:integration host factor subunit beta
LEIDAIPQSYELFVFTWAQISEAIAGAIDVPRRDAEAIVDAIFSGIVGALNRGDKVELRGFGSFRLRQRRAHALRNPRTGVLVDVPAKKVVYFKPAKELLKIINRNPGDAPVASARGTAFRAAR